MRLPVGPESSEKQIRRETNTNSGLRRRKQVTYNQGCGAGAQTILDDWIRNQTISDGGA